MTEQLASTESRPSGGNSPALPRLSLRTLRWHQVLNELTGIQLCGMLLFSPWAFGTTQPWSIGLMNAGGYLLGLLLAAQWLIRRQTGYQPARWDLPGPRHGRSFARRLLGSLTVIILAWCLVSALNARAAYQTATRTFDYFSFIPWLPHSYDRAATWDAFFNYLGLGLMFWAAQDWLSGKTAEEERARRGNWMMSRGRWSSPLPQRMQWLLWIITLNGALLGLEGMVQRLCGTNKLLFFMPTHDNPLTLAQFGPFAYRSNAAQYLNLVWPVSLAFWWSFRRNHPADPNRPGRFRWSRHFLLLAGVIVMAACPFIATTRAGAGIALLNLALAAVILLSARDGESSTPKPWLMAALLIPLAVGMTLGWRTLAPRFDREDLLTGMAGRTDLYELARPMAQDNPLFGTGPGSFGNLFQLYRRSPEGYWPQQLHNDWLETLITFGWLGTTFVVLAFLIVPVRWLFSVSDSRDVRIGLLFCVALAGCLLHARYDFPFQIHSIVCLFLVWCACLLTIPAGPGWGR